MTGRGESTDHIDGPLLHAELRRWIRADKSRENAVICLQRTKYAYEALAAVARTLSHPAMKLAWSLLLVETVRLLNLFLLQVASSQCSG